jgi:methyl-accepting chemotaxis protein
MKKIMILTSVVLIGLCFTGYALADGKAECIALCEAAVKMMKEDLGGALCEINKKGGQFYKGNIFVFAWRGPVMVAHPYLHQGIGMDLTNWKGRKGKEVTKEYMRIAKEKGSGWVDYWFPKPGEEEPSLKTTYVLKVDENFYVCAGYFK